MAGRSRAEPRLESVSAPKALGNSSDRAARRSHGAWYTPPALVDFLVEVAERLLPAAPLRILDPSCGDGRVLAACQRRWPNAELHGWDIDPAALTEAATAVIGARLEHRDVLGSASPSGDSSAFDLVIGNPPFLGQLRGDTVLSEARARALRVRFPGAIGAYTDTAAMFLRIAADLAATVVLVQPVSTLASRDAAAIRAHLSQRLAALWVANAKMFPDALVEVCVVGLSPAQPPQNGAVPQELLRWCGPTFTALPAGSRLSARSSADAQSLAADASGTWSPLLPEGFGLPRFIARSSGTLADLATATADFRDEYYALSGLVREAQPGDIPVIVSGHIDPARCLWGKTKVRLHKQAWTSPAIPGETVLPGRLAPWIPRRRVPKVLLATQSRVLEAIADPEGQYLPVTPVVSVTPTQVEDVWRVLAVLLSPFASAWALQQYGGAGFTGGAIKLAAKQVCRIPLPANLAAWNRAAAMLRETHTDAQADARADAQADARREQAIRAELDAAYGVHLRGWYSTRVRV